MALLEELLKSSRAHPQSVIVALVAVIVVGTLGGGIWIHNLQSMLESRDALRQQELAVLTQRTKEGLDRLEARINVLDETVKHHQVFLEETSSRLRELTKRNRSAEVNRQLEQIATELHDQKNQLDTPRTVLFRESSATRTSLTGSSGRPLTGPSDLLKLIVLAIIATSLAGVSWIAIRLYRQRGRRPAHN
jgi:hypothetical protein